LEAYQKLSTASAPTAADDAIDHVLEELTDRYGEPPAQVTMLIAVSRLRRAAQKAGLAEVVAMGDKLRVAPANLPDSLQVRLQRMYPGSRYFAQANAMSVPLPAEATDAALVEWVTALLAALFPAPVVVEAGE
jgi:transcription-repair coupling factor (superfamily II helicase)